MNKRELIVAKALEKAPSVIGGDPDNKYMKCGYVMGATGWVCTQARLDAQAKAYPDSAAMIHKYGAQWLGMQCYDCAQLNRVALSAAGYKLVSGATSQWNMDIWAAKGAIDKLPSDSRGVSLFIQDGTKVNHMKHVAVCLGDGTEVEARGTKYGVVRRYMRDTAFTHWAYPIDLDGAGTAIIEPSLPGYDSPAYSKPTLKRGAKGGYVAELQSRLLIHHISLKVFGVDGDFGNETLVAVKQFQGLNGLPVDGIVGPITWEALLKEPEVNQPDDPVLCSVSLINVPEDEADALLIKYPGSTKAVG
jgi:hypothetical protein